MKICGLFLQNRLQTPYLVQAMARIRLRDIAERAGVSEATVSRVLNDRPGVSAPTRSAVGDAMRALGLAAPDRVRHTEGLVGLIVPELDNPIFPALAQAIENRLAAAGFTAVLGCATQEGVDEDDYVEMLAERGVSGIVFVSGRHADMSADQRSYHELLARGMPIVLVNGHHPGIDAPSVSCDDRHASRLAVAHLASLGHERIGFVSGPQRYVVVQRKLEGFHAAMSDAGLSVDPSLVSVDAVFSVEGGHAVAPQLLGSGATAVVAASDLIALGVVRAANETGLAVPADISVVGFDDTALRAFTDPPLTTVRQPVRAMAELAARLLIDQVRAAGPHTPQREYLFRPELVVRGSSAPAGALAASGR